MTQEVLKKEVADLSWFCPSLKSRYSQRKEANKCGTDEATANTLMDSVCVLLCEHWTRVIDSSLIQGQHVKNRCVQRAEHMQPCERPVLLHTAAWCRAGNSSTLIEPLTPVIMVWSG